MEINREKTRVVDLKEEGASLDFLGFTFRYYEDLKGRGWRYLNVSPSAKAAQEGAGEAARDDHHRQCFKPIPQLIEELNRHLKGWANYFAFGYPRGAFERSNVRSIRLMQHLRRRSQRPFRPPEGVSYYEQLSDLGWSSVADRATACACLRREFSGEPDAGKSACPVRRGESGPRYSRRPLSYSTVSAVESLCAYRTRITGQGAGEWSAKAVVQ